MAKDKIKVGIVGAQFAATLHIEAYHRCPYVEVIGVASPYEDELKKFCKTYNVPRYFTDVDEMINSKEIDLISACVPSFLHKEIVIKAAKAGKNVICEKPLATKIEDGEEMIKVCKEKNVKLMYAEDWCFAPILKRVKEIYQEGGIGDILLIKAKESHQGSHSPYAQKIKFCGGGALIHLGIHPIGAALWLKEKKVVEVIGKTSGGLNKNLIHHQLEGEDFGCGILTFEDGTISYVEGNYITKGGLDDTFEVYGTKGKIQAKISLGSPLLVYSEPGYKYAVEKADTTKYWTFPSVDENAELGYVNEIAYFVDCVRLNKEIMYGVRGEDGLEALKITKAIYESAAKGVAVKI